LGYIKKQTKQEKTFELDDIYKTNNFSYDDITIVIPTLNEEEAIGNVIDDVRMNGYENIIIVDGNSTDRTVEIVKNYDVDLLNQKGKGKTGAIITAIQKIKTPYFALIDGDCTYKAEDIENLMSCVNGNLEVIGVRTQGRDNITLFNRFGNWAINTLFNLTFDTKLTDVCSGLYILKTDFARKLVLNSTGFDVEVEIAANAATKGEIAETPIGFHQRKGLQKLHPIRDGSKIMSRILREGYRLKRTRFYSLMTMALVVPGIIISLLSFNLTLFQRTFSSNFLGFFLIMMALQGGTLLLVDSRISRK
jgi:glycosyltransferase involved in cell wall biosynthesis